MIKTKESFTVLISDPMGVSQQFKTVSDAFMWMDENGYSEANASIIKTETYNSFIETGLVFKQWTDFEKPKLKKNKAEVKNGNSRTETHGL